MRFSVLVFSTLLVFCSSPLHAADDEVVIADGDVEITRAEFTAAIAAAPAQVKTLAATDFGDRFEMINGMVTSRKMASLADALTPDDEGYWELQFQLEAVKEQFFFNRLLSQIRIGNAEPLAREYYKTRKDEYAAVAEKRASSHILFLSPPGRDRTDLRVKAQQVLEELRAGADFAALVAEHSEDRNSAARGGALDRSVIFGDTSITPPYTEALFEIEEVGGYSEVTDSEFGLHIIRLDGIEPAGYLSFEEVRGRILGDIVADFRALSSKEIRSRYHLSDDAFIDGEAMEELFAPYKP